MVAGAAVVVASEIEVAAADSMLASLVALVTVPDAEPVAAAAAAPDPVIGVPVAVIAEVV